MRGSLLSSFIFAFLYSFSQDDAALKKAIDNESNPSKKIELLIQQADKNKNSNPLLSFKSAQEATKLIGTSNRIELAKAEFYMALYYNKSEKNRQRSLFHKEKYYLPQFPTGSKRVASQF